jgi:hypothetical protein
VKRNLIEHLRLLSILVPLRPGLASAPAKAAMSADLLLGLLEDKKSQSLDRAFRLLQIAHRREDVRSTALAVSSDDKRLRAQGLEYLDALTLFSPVREIQDLFRVIADDLPEADRVARSLELIPKPPVDFDDSLSHLLKDNDDSLVGVVAAFVIEYGLDELRLDVSHLTRDGVKLPSLESLVRRFEAMRGTASVA